MPLFRHDRPMESPLGKKLAAAGYQTLWEYVGKNGFTHLDQLRRDLDFESLTPQGFFDFVAAVARIDDRWGEGFRVVAAHALNTARVQYAEKTPSENWMVIQPVGFLASEFSQQIPWAQGLAMSMRDYLLAHRGLFGKEFTLDAAWLVELVAAAQTANAEQDAAPDRRGE